MKELVFSALLFIGIALSASAQSPRYQGGYVKSNGTYVEGHYKTSRNSLITTTSLPQVIITPIQVRRVAVHVITLPMLITTGEVRISKQAHEEVSTISIVMVIKPMFQKEINKIR